MSNDEDDWVDVPEVNNTWKPNDCFGGGGAQEVAQVMETYNFFSQLRSKHDDQAPEEPTYYQRGDQKQ